MLALFLERSKAMIAVPSEERALSRPCGGRDLLASIETREVVARVCMVRVLGEAQRLQEIVAGLSVYHILPKHQYPQALQKRPQIIRGSKETLVSVTIHLTQLIMIELHTTNPQPQPLLPTIPSDILSLQTATHSTGIPRSCCNLASSTIAMPLSSVSLTGCEITST